MAATAPFDRVESVCYDKQRLEVVMKRNRSAGAIVAHFTRALQELHHTSLTLETDNDSIRIISAESPIYRIHCRTHMKHEVLEIVPESDGLRTQDPGQVLELYGSLLEANRPKPRWPAAVLGAWLTFMATGCAMYYLMGETNSVLRDQTQCVTQKTQCLRDLLESKSAQLECIEREAASLHSDGTKLHDSVRITKNAAEITTAAMESEEQCLTELEAAVQTTRAATENARECSEQLKTTSDELTSCHEKSIRLLRAAELCGELREEPERPEPLFERPPQKAPGVPYMHPGERPTS